MLVIQKTKFQRSKRSIKLFFMKTSNFVVKTHSYKKSLKLVPSESVLIRKSMRTSNEVYKMLLNKWQIKIKLLNNWEKNVTIWQHNKRIKLLPGKESHRLTANSSRKQQMKVVYGGLCHQHIFKVIWWEIQKMSRI